MPPAVFLSYRRDDAAGYAGRLEDALERRLGRGRVFRDLQDIAPGEDFVATLRARLSSAQAVVVLIGPRWAGARADGTRRIDEPGDFVRLEVQTALEAGLRVLPVLLPGATMPAETDLPAPIAALARRHALALSEAHWDADLRRLAEATGIAAAGGRWRWAAGGALAAAVAVGAACWLTRPAGSSAQQAQLQQHPAPPPTGAQAPSPPSPSASLSPSASAVPVPPGAPPEPALPPPKRAPPPTAAPAPRAATATPPAVPAVPAPGAAAVERLAGRWQAELRYGWGAGYTETFEFKRHAGAWVGSASFLAFPRTIETIEFDGTNLRFTTRSEEMLGSERRWRTLVYTAEWRGPPGAERLAMRLEFVGGFDSPRAIEFEAARP